MCSFIIASFLIEFFLNYFFFVVIFSAGAGVDNIDINAATKHNVIVLK